MGIRPLALPQDLVGAADAVVEAFQYPGHPEWELDAAEQVQFADTIRRIRRIWPVMRVLQAVSPALRDVMRGFVWEEKGALVAFVVTQRDGGSPVWVIEPLGVLPEFRRRGIARKLMTEALAMMRAHGAAGVRLGVIDGNTPAQTLYRSLRLAEYAALELYVLGSRAAIGRPALPAGYIEEPLARFDGRTRYELDRRIVPPDVQDFEPVTPGRYRTPWLMRVLAPFFDSARPGDVVVRRGSDRSLVGRAGWSLSKRRGGVNSIRIRLDPSCPDLALYLVERALHEAIAADPNAQIELFLPTWMPSVARAAESLGFIRRRRHLQMGMRF